MQDRTTTAGTSATRMQTSPIAILALAALGLALFLSATWTARADASGVPTVVTYATRFVTLATCLVMAWAFRNHLPQVELLLVIACVTMLVHLGCVVAAPLLPLAPEVAVVVSYVSGLFEGVANGLVTLLFGHVISTFVPRRSVLAVGAAYLLVDVCILFLDTLSMPTLHYARPAFKLASLVILVCCAHALLKPRPDAPGADHSLQYGMARAGGEEERPLTFLSSNVDWFLLLIVAFLFPNLFGVIAQVSSETGGNFALYDIPTEVAMVALQGLFLIFLGAFGTRFGFPTILAFMIPLYATGFALFPSNWAQGNPFAGCLIRAGYVLLAVLIWALMSRRSYDDPRHTYLYFGIYCGISDAQVGRLTGSALMGGSGPSLELCQGISIAALWAICIFGLVMFFLLYRGLKAAIAGRGGIPVNAACHAEDATDTPNMPHAGTRAAAGVPTTDAFGMQFEALARRVHLTPREREAVLEALHGYSRANIARKLNLSPETVKTYLNRAYAKAQVTSKQELVALVERERL